MSEITLQELKALIAEFIAASAKTIENHKQHLERHEACLGEQQNTLKASWERVNELVLLVNEQTKLIEANRTLTLLMWRHLGLPESVDGPSPKVN